MLSNSQGNHWEKLKIYREKEMKKESKLNTKELSIKNKTNSKIAEFLSYHQLLYMQTDWTLQLKGTLTEQIKEIYDPTSKFSIRNSF